MEIDTDPSSPLSIASRTPSPPCGYPSPTSIQQSASRSSSKSREIASDSVDPDGPPPAKKRKLAEPKKRTTEYLDLRDCYDDSQPHDALANEHQLQRLLKELRKKQKIVVIAGAGISVSAGIPDFRSSTGLFSTLRSQHKLKASGKHLFDASVYKSGDSTTSFHNMVRELSHLTQNARPTLFHHMLATLAEEGRLLRLYSQNVDGIDTSMIPLATNVPLNPKGPWPKTIQLHGGLEKMVCTKCGELSKFDGHLFEGPEPPSCEACETIDNLRTTMAGKRSHGIGRLRPRMVLYNEFNPDEEAIGAVTAADLRSRPDAVIVVGTSLKVPGVRRIAREMCWVARGRRDGFTAWINHGPEPVGAEFKDCWDLVVRGDCDEVARQAALPQWDDKDVGMYSAVTKEVIEKTKVNITVHIDAKHKAVENTQGMVTPTASPRHQSPVPWKGLPKFKQPQLISKTKSNKAKTKVPAKPKKASKKDTARKPSNTITKSFGVSKISKAVTAKKAAPERSLSPTPVLNLFPNLTTKAPPPMQPISPSEVRNNSDASMQLQEEAVRYCQSLKSDTPESVYDTPESRRSRSETISPKGGIPKNMGPLLS
ncbi:MAG: hypothetical protein M1818_005848 [Claussenomyces sp. TS43310]|nr:MAG: hypothetical protein M1818_005848 [Claussenomyces sp. TS43310]